MQQGRAQGKSSWKVPAKGSLDGGRGWPRANHANFFPEGMRSLPEKSSRQEAPEPGATAVARPRGPQSRRKGAWAMVLGVCSLAGASTSAVCTFQDRGGGPSPGRSLTGHPEEQGAPFCLHPPGHCSSPAP